MAMEPPRVAILSSPGMGHLIPLAEFASLLVKHHSLAVTLITYSDFSSPSQQSLLSTLSSPMISSLSLPPCAPDLPSDARVETRISALVARSAPSVKSHLQTLKSSTNLVAYVIDLFGGDTLPAAKELGIPHFMFFTSNFFMLSFMFHLPTLDETTACEFRDLPEPLKLPGCVPLEGDDFLHPLQDRSDEAYRWVVNIARRLREVDGMLVNSFGALEPDTIRALSAQPGIPPAYPAGPIVRRAGAGGDGSGCLGWLDRQPRGSVLFVSFGSGGTLSCEQVRELALGLELSGQRFLWVVRIPSDSESNATFFGFRDESDPLNFLPDGFLSRTEGFGLAIPNWAPQVEVLGHSAVGGFLTHCGWNSTLESLMSGVPLIAWPLYAEQKMNAVMLEEGAAAALRARAGGEGVVGRAEVGRVVRELMEGEKGKAVRDKARELQEEGVRAWETEGSSCMALAEVVKKWKSACVV